MKKILFSVLLALLLLASSACAEAALSLNKPQLTVLKGKTEKLVPVLTGTEKTGVRYTWTASDTSVLSVSNGQVRGKKAGTAKVTCRTSLPDGTALSAVCTVTVLQPVTGLKIRRKAVSVTEGEYRSVSADCQPADASNPAVLWESSDPGIAAVTSAGFVKGISAGTCTVTGTAADGSGKTVKAEITVEPRVPVQAVNFSRRNSAENSNQFTVTLRSLTRRRKIESLTFTVSIDGKVQNSRFEFTRSLPHGGTDRDGWWKNALLNRAKTVQVLLLSVRYSDGQIVFFDDRPVIGTFELQEVNPDVNP